MGQDKVIEVKNGRVHNLKGVDISLPLNKLIVFTGLSGSGKSSLAFDTIYAEGQRRYVESLSAYARQFLGRMNKPEVDYIKGIPPAIAIEQKVTTRNPRSTVGTSTEIYDYIRLLYARIGRTYSPDTNTEVKKHNVSDVIVYLKTLADNTKILILAPLQIDLHISSDFLLTGLQSQGVNSLEKNGEEIKINDIIKSKLPIQDLSSYRIVVDKVKATHDEEKLNRIMDSVQTAFDEGNGTCVILSITEGKKNEEATFSNRFECDGIEFQEPTEHLFSFNNPLGACPKCEGYGMVLGIDENLVIPNKTLSVYDDAVVCWRGEKVSAWKENVITNALKSDFPIHKPYFELSDKQKHDLWHGTKNFWGINAFFDELEEKKYKIQNRIMLARFRGKTKCPECNGSRLRKEAGYVKINNTSITQLVDISIEKLVPFFDQLTLTEYEQTVGKRLLIEIQNRLQFLRNVGLGYLTLNRLSATLSGGESQRINLATSLGSSLVGSLYVLDEPSIGLHPRDTNLLIGVLRDLQKIGNTVIVVEHDEEIMKSADMIVDIGPLAGRLGGEIVYAGTVQEMLKQGSTLTAKYLNGIEKIDIPTKRRTWNNFIELKGVRENNLKNFDVKIPLGIMTVVTGVSGSGKSSLIGGVFYPAIKKSLGEGVTKIGEHTALDGDIKRISQIEYIDQNPIGKSSRSNPVTYIKAYDEIRKLFSTLKQAKYNNLTASSFSFNVPGGRCEECQGEGTITVEMQFMADVKLLCESCNGKRFKDVVLEVTYQDKNIYDVLEMTVNEAIEFFNESKIGHAISEKLKPLADVGLGYIKLGQSSSTLSGGESQRVKLASFLSKGSSLSPHIFVFDEPTTGLHFHDIHTLLQSFNALVNQGHTLVIIEHNLDVIKSADWIIDLGPDGGENGGNLLFSGIPEDIIHCKASYTGQYLSEKLKK